MTTLPSSALPDLLTRTRKQTRLFHGLSTSGIVLLVAFSVSAVPFALGAIDVGWAFYVVALSVAIAFASVSGRFFKPFDECVQRDCKVSFSSIQTGLLPQERYSRLTNYFEMRLKKAQQRAVYAAVFNCVVLLGATLLFACVTYRNVVYHRPTGPIQIVIPAEFTDSLVPRMARPSGSSPTTQQYVLALAGLTEQNSSVVATAEPLISRPIDPDRGASVLTDLAKRSLPRIHHTQASLNKAQIDLKIAVADPSAKNATTASRSLEKASEDLKLIANDPNMPTATRSEMADAATETADLSYAAEALSKDSSSIEKRGEFLDKAQAWLKKLQNLLDSIVKLIDQIQSILDQIFGNGAGTSAATKDADMGPTDGSAGDSEGGSSGGTDAGNREGSSSNSDGSSSGDVTATGDGASAAENPSGSSAGGAEIPNSVGGGYGRGLEASLNQDFQQSKPIMLYPRRNDPQYANVAGPGEVTGGSVTSVKTDDNQQRKAGDNNDVSTDEKVKSLNRNSGEFNPSTN